MMRPPVLRYLKDPLPIKNTGLCLPRAGVAVVLAAATLLALFSTAIFPALAQEVYLRYGTTLQQTSSRDYSYSLGPNPQGLGEYGVWSPICLNEGHVTVHKRDGLTPQLWGRINILNRKVSLAASAGPYLYSNAGPLPRRGSYPDDYGVGAMFSLAATLYTESRFLLHVRSNWALAPHGVNTSVTTIGVGYQEGNASSPVLPAGGTSPQNSLKTNNEIAFLAGVSFLNGIGHKHVAAESIEYRRGLGQHFDWTIGWLNEVSHVSRTGPATQLWVTRAFFGDHLGLGLGAGPYLAFDSHGDRDVTKVNWLVSGTAHYLLVRPQWSLRFTWNRVSADNNRDADIVLAGVGYRF